MGDKLVTPALKSKDSITSLCTGLLHISELETTEKQQYMKYC